MGAFARGADLRSRVWSRRATKGGQRHGWPAILGQAVRSPRGKVGLGLVGSVVLVAVIGPALEPHSPDALLAVPFAKPSGAFPLGADVLGRDVLSRTLAGGWLLLLMAAAATVLGVAVGATVGMTAAYVRGPADGLLMRTVDVILAFPQLLFALLLVSIVGPKLWLIIIAVACTHAPPVARVVRAAALDVAERDFVKVVELQGVRRRRILTGEILPNLVSPLMVETGLRMTYSIIVIAGLAFLGFGQPPPTANWGLMINENRGGIEANPWTVLAPVILIALLTIGMNTFTDAIARVTLGVDRRAATSPLPEIDPSVAGLAPPP